MNENLRMHLHTRSISYGKDSMMHELLCLLGVHRNARGKQKVESLIKYFRQNNPEFTVEIGKIFPPSEISLKRRAKALVKKNKVALLAEKNAREAETE